MNDSDILFLKKVADLSLGGRVSLTTHCLEMKQCIYAECSGNLMNVKEFPATCRKYPVKPAGVRNNYEEGGGWLSFFIFQPL